MNAVATASSAPPALVLDSFTLGLQADGARQMVLEDCDLEVPAGGFYLLAGRSGTGKSTLLKWLTGLWDTREARLIVHGQCRLLGQKVTVHYPPSLRSRVAAVLQDEGLLDELSPRGNVELALQAAGRSTRLAVALLSQAGLENPPSEVAALSGGMRKRTGVARGLAAQPRLFLFDEPTAGLDAEAARAIAVLLHETHEQADGRTTIVITHDEAAFAGMASGILELVAERRVLVLRDPAVDLALPAPGPAQEPPRHPDRIADPIYEAGKRLLDELGGLTQTLGQALVYLPPLFPRLCHRSIVRHTIDSAFFVGIGAAMLGFLTTFFALQNSPLEGAFQGPIIVGVGKVLVSVLTPLMVGFFFTARMAAGAAARLGTMQRTNQIAALRLMGIRPVEYLLSPLIWGFCIALPIVTFGSIVLAALGSAASAALVTGLGLERWRASFFHGTNLEDLSFVALKTGISGFFVAVWAYHLAMAPKRSGLEVGKAVNQSIVAGMLTVLVIHGLLTFWQFA